MESGRRRRPLRYLMGSRMARMARRVDDDDNTSILSSDPFLTDRKNVCDPGEAALRALLGVLSGDPDTGSLFQSSQIVPVIDDDVQQVGGEVLILFESRVQKLDNQLRTFADLAKHLGSSSSIIVSVSRLCDRLSTIIERDPPDEPNGADINPGPGRDIDLSDAPKIGLPSALKGLAQDLHEFLDCLNDIPGGKQHRMNATLTEFRVNLDYWASCLGQYEGQLERPAMRTYVHDLTADLGDQIDRVNTALVSYTKDGIASIQEAQRDNVTRYVNLSAVATLFSAVTATTMQFSHQQTGTALQNIVNIMWFTSLVFSTGSVVNSLLSVIREQHSSCPLPSRQPWWVDAWLKRCPLLFLVLSVACFSIGLALFAFSSHQHPATAALTTTFSALSCFGAWIIAGWFVWARWTRILPPSQATEAHTQATPKLGAPGPVPVDDTWWKGLRLAPSWMPLWRPKPRTMDIEAVDSDTKSEYDAAVASIPTLVPPLGEAVARSSLSRPEPLAPKSEVSALRASFTSRKAFLRNIVARPRSRSLNSVSSEALVAQSRQMVTQLKPRLMKLAPIQNVAAYPTLIEHMEFSPDGKLLASTSRDMTSIVFDVGLASKAPLRPHPIHMTGSPEFVRQVAWSPDGKFLMFKGDFRLKIWAVGHTLQKIIQRQCRIQSVVWMPSSKEFLSIESDSITRMRVNGSIIGKFEFKSMSLCDASVTTDTDLIICVGTVLRAPDGSRPANARAEKQIIVYDLKKNAMTSRVPVLHDVRAIALTRPVLSRSGQMILVSYQRKAPPQLWTLDEGGQLSLRHTYKVKVPVEFAGSSSFGGEQDELVVSAGRDGNIHIWDRESGALLRHVRPPLSPQDDVMFIAWNPKAMMFATAFREGTIEIWAEKEETTKTVKTQPDSATTPIQSGYPLSNPSKPSPVTAPVTRPRSSSFDTGRKDKCTSVATSDDLSEMGFGLFD